MPRVRFTTQLVPDDGYTFIYFSRSLLGTNGRVKIKGTINGHPFTTTAQPWREEQYLLTVNAQMRQRMGLSGGEKVEVVIEPDAGPAPEIIVPPDLAQALRARLGADDAFDKAAPSHRRYYVEWVESAKRPATRASRIARTVSMVLAGVDPFHPR